MNKFYTCVLAAMAAVFPMSANLTSSDIEKNSFSQVITAAPFEFNEIARTGVAQSRITRAATDVTFDIHITKPSNYLWLTAGYVYLGSNGGIQGLFGIADSENYVTDGYGNRNMTAPDSEKILACALGYTPDRLGLIVIQKEVEVKEGMTIDLNYEDAVNRTDLKMIGPDGKHISFADRNVYSGDAIMEFEYKGQYMADWQLTLFADGMTHVLSNQAEGLDFTFVNMMSTPQGVLIALIPVDLTAQECASTDKGWQLGEITGAPTPINLKYDEVFPGNPYSLARNMVLIGNDYRRIDGVAVYGNCNTGQVGLWMPENYEGKYNIAGLPMLDVLSSDKTCIAGQPVFRTPDGLRQAGLSMLFDMGFAMKNFNTEIFSRSNPQYAYAPTGKFGNYPPALVTVPTDANAFNYSFIGRHAESCLINSFDLYEAFHPELAEKYGDRQTNNVTVTRDGQEVCSGRDGFPAVVIWNTGKYEAEISTDNVIVDGDIDGLTTGHLEYTATGQDIPLPTVTALQFRNADDDVTDRFAVAADGTLRLYAADMYVQETSIQKVRTYNNAGIKSVTAEYAPMRTGEFKPLEVTADHSQDFMPGFGEYFSAPLSAVNVPSETKWYDLRVTVEDRNGSKQVQVISPAFQIEEILGGVENVAIDNKPLEVRLEGRNIICPDNARVFTASGELSGRTNLSDGVYVVTNGKKAVKVIVK